MIREYEIYHGIVFSRLFNASSTPISAASYRPENNASYILKRDNKVAGLYIKHSTKRLSPWRFTFLREHQEEIAKLKSEFGEVFLALVCGHDGVATLNYEELKSLLDYNYEPTEWISVARGKRQMYKIEGKDGILDCKKGNSEFPKKIIEFFDGISYLDTRKLENNLLLHASA